MTGAAHAIARSHILAEHTRFVSIIKVLNNFIKFFQKYLIYMTNLFNFSILYKYKTLIDKQSNCSQLRTKNKGFEGGRSNGNGKRKRNGI